MGHPDRLLANPSIRGALALSAAALALIAALTAVRSVAPVFADRPKAASAASAPRSSFLYRFDPDSRTFFTLALPVGSTPYGLAVTGTNPTHVWLAEYGLNRIGHVVYTNAHSFSYSWHPVTSTSGSGPFRIALRANYVWFTERGANRIGRLNANTGVIDEFFGNGLSPNSGLADIRVAPDGWVWAAGQSSNRLIRLVVVTSTQVFSFREISHADLQGVFGLYVPANEAVWFASPGAGMAGKYDVVQDKIRSLGFFLQASVPYEIVTTGIYAWFTDQRRNAIDQTEVATLGNVTFYTPTTRPAGLALESATGGTIKLWYTQQDQQGVIGRFTYTQTPPSHRFDPFPLPLPGLRPTGIAVAADRGVWSVAFAPVQIQLPHVVKNHSN